MRRFQRIARDGHTAHDWRLVCGHYVPVSDAEATGAEYRIRRRCPGCEEADRLRRLRRAEGWRLMTEWLRARTA